MQSYAMQLTGKGINDDVLGQIDRTHAAARISMRPLDHSSSGGHYTLIGSYSNTAAKPAANSDVFSLRWTDPQKLFVLFGLRVYAVTTTAYTASANQDFALFVARSFTVSPSGGTQIIPLAGGQRTRTAGMKSTGLDGTSGVLWVSSGDLLTAGTRTLDTQGVGYFAWLNAITPPNAPSQGDLYDPRYTGRHWLTLQSNEGLVIQTPIGNAQAAGVTKYTFIMDYAELTTLD